MSEAVSPLDALKNLTRPMHERLERSPRLARLLSPDLSRLEYCDVLERMLGYQDQAERAIGAHADRLPLDFDARRKTHLLAYDLERLGYARRTIDELPRCPYTPPVTDIDSALGVLYVLEGATLGGRIIRRYLERTIRVTADSGAAYYAGYGANTGVMWKSMGTAIKDRAAEVGSITPIVVSACATFTALNRWMTR